MTYIHLLYHHQSREADIGLNAGIDVLGYTLTISGLVEDGTNHVIGRLTKLNTCKAEPELTVNRSMR
jgi:hypothetical protein